MFNQDKIIKKSIKLAEKAKPGFLKIGDKLYSFEFCHKDWVYRVYEDGFWLINFNTKNINTAKRFLKDWLSS